MKQWIGRTVLAFWFVGMVVVAVGDRTAEGQPLFGAGQQYFSLMMRKVPGQLDPPFHAYVALAASTLDGDSDIYTFRGDGSEFRQLTNDSDTNDVLPQWSPDGSQIVFLQELSSDPMQLRVMTMDGDGGNLRPLLEGWVFNQVSELQWEPNGNTFLIAGYLSDAGSDYWLWRVNSDGSNPTPVARPWSPAWGWSPDGRYIYWVGEGDTLWIQSVLEGQVRLIGNQVTSFFWNPDSLDLLIVQQEDPDFMVMRGQVVTPDGSSAVTLFEGNYLPIGWVKGGTAFLVKDLETTKLYTTPRNGGETILITPLDELITGPLITPSGGALIYYHFDNSDGRRYLYYHPLDEQPRHLIGIIWDVSVGYSFASLSESFDRSGLIFTLDIFGFRVDGWETYFLPLSPDVGEMEFMLTRHETTEYLPFANTRAVTFLTQGSYPYPRVPEQWNLESFSHSPIELPHAAYLIGEWRYMP